MYQVYAEVMIGRKKVAEVLCGEFIHIADAHQFANNASFKIDPFSKWAQVANVMQANGFIFTVRG